MLLEWPSSHEWQARPRADGRERRAFTRVDPVELVDPLVARVKYGEPVTLLDVSAGGALIETRAALRPDASLVLEVMGAGAQDLVPVVSRVIRCHVSSVNGGIRYRGACAFKRPLDHPGLTIANDPVLAMPPGDFMKPEFALKTIVEGYRRRGSAQSDSGRWRDPAALVDALEKLRDATERRSDATDRRLGQLLSAVAPVLRRNESADAVMTAVLEHLRKHVPGLGIRVGARGTPTACEELLTLNVWSEPSPGSAMTAEIPAGCELDASQFRLLKAGAYLMGLAERWSPQPPPVVSAEPIAEPAPALDKKEAAPLPPGWQRVVVRYVDGTLLRGYCNDFHPERPHLHLSPEINCASGERLNVPVARLKAVFFVRDLSGDQEHVDTNVFDHVPRARKVEVTFRDGEVMQGSTLNYKPQGQGFLLTPANSRGNNLRVYVVMAAMRHMRFV
jgi:hypothetical protein